MRYLAPALVVCEGTENNRLTIVTILVAICGFINPVPHAIDEACTTCLRRPDYYDVAGTHATTQQEPGIAATDIEDR